MATPPILYGVSQKKDVHWKSFFLLDTMANNVRQIGRFRGRNIHSPKECRA